MIAQLVLTALSFAILLYAWMEYPRSPAVGLFAWLAALGGLYFVWVPSHATQLAALVGIGRGVDLIIYTWVGISLLLLLNLHLKLRTGQIQAVVATDCLLVDRRNSSSASAGVLHSSVLRGLVLRAVATAAISLALYTLRSVPFGKYCRSSPLVFSLVARCHGLCGSQK
jgi:hypothetical protein